MTVGETARAGVGDAEAGEALEEFCFRGIVHWAQDQFPHGNYMVSTSSRFVLPFR